MAKPAEMPYGDVTLKARQGVPWDFTIEIPGEDWSGTYECRVSDELSEAGTTMCEPTVTATYDGTKTTMTIVLAVADSDTVPVGDYFWDMRKDTGEVPLGGRVHIGRTVTP